MFMRDWKSLSGEFADADKGTQATDWLCDCNRLALRSPPPPSHVFPSPYMLQFGMRCGACTQSSPPCSRTTARMTRRIAGAFRYDGVALLRILYSSSTRVLRRGHPLGNLRRTLASLTSASLPPPSMLSFCRYATSPYFVVCFGARLHE